MKRQWRLQLNENYSANDTKKCLRLAENTINSSGRKHMLTNRTEKRRNWCVCGEIFSILWFLKNCRHLAEILTWTKGSPLPLLIKKSEIKRDYIRWATSLEDEWVAVEWLQIFKKESTFFWRYRKDYQYVHRMEHLTLLTCLKSRIKMFVLLINEQTILLSFFGGRSALIRTLSTYLVMLFSSSAIFWTVYSLVMI